MIKFSILKENEPHIIGFVLSYSNLDLLLEGKPIFFDLKECGVPNCSGPCIICYDDDKFREAFPKLRVSWCFVMSKNTIENLRKGQEINFSRSDVNIVFVIRAGKNEHDIYLEMQKSIGPKTKVKFKGFPPSDIPQNLN
jgi:hypothetical protein